MLLFTNILFQQTSKFFLKKKLPLFLQRVKDYELWQKMWGIKAKLFHNVKCEQPVYHIQIVKITEFKLSTSSL